MAVTASEMRYIELFLTNDGSLYDELIASELYRLNLTIEKQITFRPPSGLSSSLFPPGTGWTDVAKGLGGTISSINFWAEQVTHQNEVGVPVTVPKFAYLRDCKHLEAIAAGNTYDGHIYHQIDGVRLNCQWYLVFAENANGIDYYYLYDRKHNKALVAGDNYDNRVYHQDPAGRLNAQWMFTPGTFPDSWLIKDRKHGKCLAAGDINDNNTYHQAPNGRANAHWTIEVVMGTDIVYGL